MPYYIGIISGTSMDAIDCVCCEFSDSPRRVNLIASHRLSMPGSCKNQIRALLEPGENELAKLCRLDRELGHLFAQAVSQLCEKAHLPAAAIAAIGSHGQTIRHAPDGKLGYSLQVADANTIAALTGITTVADFRRRDVALGGQGAPLACRFHEYLMRDKSENRIVLNLGGIANITYLPKTSERMITGFDTGPANTLIDAVCRQYFQIDYDDRGQLAASGELNEALLAQLLTDPYFQRTGPKSTGLEYFNSRWLDHHLAKQKYKPQDLLCTVTELTAKSISDAIAKHYPETDSIWLCGGGAYNEFLTQRLHALNSGKQLHATAELGIPPEWIEAVAFAWLAEQTLAGRPSNQPSVTGAQKATLLGGVYYAHAD